MGIDLSPFPRQQTSEYSPRCCMHPTISHSAYEIMKSSRPCGSSGNHSFYRVFPFSWALSSRARTDQCSAEDTRGTLYTSECPFSVVSVLCLTNSSHFGLSELSTPFLQLSRRPLCSAWVPSYCSVAWTLVALKDVGQFSAIL